MMFADRTQPVPAPNRMKWVVSESMLTYDDRRCFELGLWDEATSVDPAHGWGRHPKITHLLRPRYSKLFMREREILRASKNVLAQYHEASEDELRVARLIGPR